MAPGVGREPCWEGTVTLCRHSHGLHRTPVNVMTCSPPASADLGASQGGPSGRHWVLDPIDGTRGFVGMRQYSVCLGMLQDGEVRRRPGESAGRRLNRHTVVPGTNQRQGNEDGEHGTGVRGVAHFCGGSPACVFRARISRFSGVATAIVWPTYTPAQRSRRHGDGACKLVKPRRWMARGGAAAQLTHSAGCAARLAVACGSVSAYAVVPLFAAGGAGRAGLPQPAAGARRRR